MREGDIGRWGDCGRRRKEGGRERASMKAGGMETGREWSNIFHISNTVDTPKCVSSYRLQSVGTG